MKFLLAVGLVSAFRISGRRLQDDDGGMCSAEMTDCQNDDDCAMSLYQSYVDCSGQCPNDTEDGTDGSDSCVSKCIMTYEFAGDSGSALNDCYAPMTGLIDSMEDCGVNACMADADCSSQIDKICNCDDDPSIEEGDDMGNMICAIKKCAQSDDYQLSSMGQCMAQAMRNSGNGGKGGHGSGHGPAPAPGPRPSGGKGGNGGGDYDPCMGGNGQRQHGVPGQGQRGQDYGPDQPKGQPDQDMDAQMGPCVDACLQDKSCSAILDQFDPDQSEDMNRQMFQEMEDDDQQTFMTFFMPCIQGPGGGKGGQDGKGDIPQVTQEDMCTLDEDNDEVSDTCLKTNCCDELVTFVNKCIGNCQCFQVMSNMGDAEIKTGQDLADFCGRVGFRNDSCQSLMSCATARQCLDDDTDKCGSNDADKCFDSCGDYIPCLDPTFGDLNSGTDLNGNDCSGMPRSCFKCVEYLDCMGDTEFGKLPSTDDFSCQRQQGTANRDSKQCCDKMTTDLCLEMQQNGMACPDTSDHSAMAHGCQASCGLCNYDQPERANGDVNQVDNQPVRIDGDVN